MEGYRHENKYIIDGYRMKLLSARLASALKADAHSDGDSRYHIRSLYFDDYDNSCYYENEGGVEPREKYRIRYYNGDTSRIVLEKKIKRMGMTKKESCILTNEECKSLMRGMVPSVTADMLDMKKKLLTQMRLRALKPKVIVSYDREAYVFATGNVRITFDMNISASANVSMFLEKTFPQRPVMAGELILEIKWDGILPDFIRKLITDDKIRRTSFSKYYVCRKYNNNGGTA